MPFFIYNYNQPTQTFSGTNSVPKSKIKSHEKLVKSILLLIDDNNKATYLNPLSILHTHHLILSKSNIFTRIKFLSLVKNVTSKEFRKSLLYKNS